MGVNGRSTVRDSLKLEQIVGSPDMTPAAIAAEAKKAGLPASIALPTVDVAGKAIDTGGRARAFANYMRIHTLEATGGLTYAQMGRFIAKPAAGKVTDCHGGTSDRKYASSTRRAQPVDNGLRNLWVTETALTTALNTSYMAEQLALFGIVVGVALLLPGIGFAILAIGGALRNPETALRLASKPSSTRAARDRLSTQHHHRPRAAEGGSRCSATLEQALRERVADELGAARQPELLHDVRAVRLGGAHRDVELLGDLLVRVPEREQAQDLALAV